MPRKPELGYPLSSHDRVVLWRLRNPGKAWQARQKERVRRRIRALTRRCNELMLEAHDFGLLDELRDAMEFQAGVVEWFRQQKRKDQREANPDLPLERGDLGWGLTDEGRRLLYDHHKQEMSERTGTPVEDIEDRAVW
jgi:hypothetical protein